MGFLQDVEGAYHAANNAANKGVGAVGSFVKDIPRAVEGAPKQVAQWGKDIAGGAEQDASLLSGLFSGGPSAPKPPAAGKGVVPTPAPPAVTIPNQAVGTANQAMDSLISEYTSTLGAVAPYESGQMGKQAAGQASQMGQNIAAGGASAQGAFGNVDATQNADYQKIAAADTQGSAGVSKALGDLRSADAQGLQVSPYAGLLTALTSGVTYRAEFNPQPGALPGSSGSMPAWLQSAYSNAIGSNAISTAGGTTPGAGTSAGLTGATNPTTNAQTGISGGP